MSPQPPAPADHSAQKELALLAGSTRLDYAEGKRLWGAIFTGMPKGLYDNVRVNLEYVEAIDSQGGAWLRRIAREGRSRGIRVSFENASGGARDMLEMIRSGFDSQPPGEPRQIGMFEAIGDAVFSGIQEARDGWRLLCDTAYWTVVAPFTPKGFRWGTFVDELHEIGVRSIGLTTLINVLMGFIVTILMADQARKYGAEIFVSDALAVGFARELGVVMTSVVVAARSGTYMAAEIATMGVQEEIDSLRAMGKNPVQFLVAPKLLAVNVAMPILTLISVAAGIFGGTAVATIALNIPVNQWLAQMSQTLTFFDIAQGLIKSFVFGSIIVFIGCHNGLRVSGGARGVGIATTRSVVQDVVLVVIVDMVFAVFFTAISQRL